MSSEKEMECKKCGLTPYHKYDPNLLICIHCGEEL